MSDNPVTLGEKYRDTITGFEGTATARHEYMYGCVRYTIERGVEGKVEAEVFDEQRLLSVQPVAVPAPTARSGGDRSAPSARSTGARR